MKQLRGLNVAKREATLGVTERRIKSLYKRIGLNIGDDSNSYLKLISELESNEALATGYRRSITRSLNKAKTIEENMFANALKKYNISIENLNRELKEIEDIFEQVKNMPLSKKVTKNLFFKELKSISGPEKYQMIKDVYFPARASMSTRADRIALKSMSAHLSETDRMIYEPFVGALSHIKFYKGKDIDLLIEATMAKLSPEGRKTLITLTENTQLFKRVTNLYNFEPK